MSLTAIASGAFGLGKSVGIDFSGITQRVSGWFGGASCSDADKKNRKKLAQAIEQHTTRAERVEFIRSTGSSTSRIKPTGQGMAYFFFGEDDCKHKNVSNKHKKFNNRLQSWLERKASEKMDQASSGSQARGGSQASSGSQAGTSWIKWLVGAGVVFMLFNLVQQGKV